MAGDQGERRIMIGLLPAQRQLQRLQQLGLADGLAEISGNAQLTATGAIAAASGGGQQDHAGIGKLGLLLDTLDQAEAFYLGHMQVHDHQRKGNGSFGRLPQSGQGFSRAAHQGGQHAPTLEGVERFMTAGLVFYHQRAHAPQVGGLRQRGSWRFRHAKSRGEAKYAAHRGRAFQPDASGHEFH